MAVAIPAAFIGAELLSSIGTAVGSAALGYGANKIFDFGSKTIKDIFKGKNKTINASALKSIGAKAFHSTLGSINKIKKLHLPFS